MFWRIQDICHITSRRFTDLQSNGNQSIKRNYFSRNFRIVEQNLYFVYSLAVFACFICKRNEVMWVLTWLLFISVFSCLKNLVLYNYWFLTLNAQSSYFSFNYNFRMSLIILAFSTFYRFRFSQELIKLPCTHVLRKPQFLWLTNEIYFIESIKLVFRYIHCLVDHELIVWLLNTDILKLIGYSGETNSKMLIPMH